MSSTGQMDPLELRVYVCVWGCPFIYFSGGENSLAQLIFQLTLAYGETAGGGEGGGGECILKIENRVNGNAWKYKRIWEELFLRIKITNGFEKVLLELKTEQLHTWRATESVKRVETKSDQLRLWNTGPGNITQGELTNPHPCFQRLPSLNAVPASLVFTALWSLL